MKRLLSFFLIIPFSLFSHAFPPALTFSLLAPLVTNNPNISEAVSDGLDFVNAKQMAFSLELPHTQQSTLEPEDDEYQNGLLTCSYQLKYYKEAGNPHEPFHGIKGRFNIQLNYDGLSLQLCKSRILREKIHKRLAPIITVTPIQEFYIKLTQLVWTIAQKQSLAPQKVSEYLLTLCSRLRHTPGGETCYLYGLPFLETEQHPGFETFLKKAPLVFAAKFIALSQKLSSLIQLFTSNSFSTEKHAFLNALMAHIDYYHTEQYHIELPRGGTITIPFSYTGSGDHQQPFTGTEISIDLPQVKTESIAASLMVHIPHIVIPLSPLHECAARCILLLMHHRKNPLAPHVLAAELSTLFTRLNLTQLNEHESSSQLRAALGLLCHYHQKILHYDFSQPLTTSLNNNALLLQLGRLGYKTYTMSAENVHSAQEITDFFTFHLADTLRCYEGLQQLREEVLKPVPLTIAQQSVTVNPALFIHTLTSPAPIHYEEEETELL